MAMGHLNWGRVAAIDASPMPCSSDEPAPGRGESVSIVRARSSTPMTIILTPLSVLSALVFTALMVVALVEAIDAHGRTPMSGAM
jgi:hypothetical protein